MAQIDLALGSVLSPVSVKIPPRVSSTDLIGVPLRLWTTPLRLELPVGQLGRLTGQTETLPPIVRDDDGSGGPLDRDQEAALIGEPVPVVFARWRSALPEGQAGGVTISPKAVDGPIL